IRGTTHVTVSGDLDLHTRQQTAAVLDELDNCEADDVIVDLQDLGFMDSTGVSALLTLAHTVRRRAGRIRLRGASRRDRFLLDVRGGWGWLAGTTGADGRAGADRPGGANGDSIRWGGRAAS